MDEIETQVADKILQIMATVTELKYSSFDEVKTLHDFNENMLPGIQWFDVAQDFEPDGSGWALVNWTIAAELVMKTTVDGIINQRDLWNLRGKIQDAVCDEIDLGIAGVIQIFPINNVTDLHLLQPYYVSRTEYRVLWRRRITGNCNSV